MKNNKIFRKIIDVSKNNNVELTHNSQFILMGSCFSSEIGKRLNSTGFMTHQPFGTIFNPITIGDNLNRLYENKFFTKNDLTTNKGIYYSWNHSSKEYNEKDSINLLSKLNAEIEVLHHSLCNNPVILLTFGTSIVYEYQNKIVGNCHKQPNNYFTKKRLSVNEVVDLWKNIIPKFPNKSFVFTVSPVRHYRDGSIENNRSKAVLILAIDELLKLFPKQISYFPSYEIVIDELRDYRFYNSDMIHPSNESVEYIWSKFQEVYMNKNTKDIVRECEKIRQSLNHKNISKNKDEYRIFLNNLKDKINHLSIKTTLYNWEDEIKWLDKELLN